MTRRAHDPLVTLSNRDVLRIAARHLATYAGDLRRGHTVDGRWPDADPGDVQAKIEHRIACALARRLRRIARGKKP